MTDYRDMYNTTENSLNDRTINNLLDLYSEQKDIYIGLVKYNTSKKKYKGEYVIQIRDDFYKKLFNIWRDNVLNLSNSQVNDLIKKGYVDKDYYDLKDYLINKSDISGYKDFLRLSRQEGNLIGKYCFLNTGSYSGWNHIKSRNLKSKLEDPINVEHRLYLNTESVDTEKVTGLFVDKCMEKNLPFYFKYDELGYRDDTIVIYSDTEHLQEYINILKKMKKENKELFSRFGEPPMLTGKIDGVIGYGSEPLGLENGEKSSFNTIRSKAIVKGISKTVNDWICNNQDMTIRNNGQYITIKDYLAKQITDSIYNVVLDNIKENSSVINSKNAYNMYGLYSNDFKGNQLKNLINYYVDNNMNNAIYNKQKNIPLERLKQIPTRDGKYIPLFDNDINKSFCGMTSKIKEHDSNFFKKVKKNIISEAKKSGIDTDKFCFDVSSKRMLFDYDKDSVKNEEISCDEIDISNICSIIGTHLLNKNYKLPNGISISGRQYIQEYLFSKIPETGYFILKNGLKISCKQYIEEFVFSYGQNNYNGDVDKLINETTKRNCGVITIQNKDNSIQINSNNLSDYLNPNLMRKVMKFSDGTTIPAKKYVNKYFSPYVPEDGQMILKNGEKISVQQYVNHVLMVNGQYNGNIKKLLDETTKSNSGFIHLNNYNNIQLEAMLNNGLNNTNGSVKSR